MKKLLKKIKKNNNGYTGMDLSVSLIVILLSVSVIASLIYNMYFAGTGMKRNVISTEIAVNFLEKILAADYSLVTLDKENLDEITGLNGNIDEEENYYIASVNNYDIKINIEKYSDRFNENEKEDFLKIITIDIAYNLGKKQGQNNEINTEVLTIRTLKTIN